MKIKRVIGFALTGMVVAWSSWSCISFSLAFGYDTTTLRMISFCGAEIFDLLIKDNATSLLISSLLVLASILKAAKVDTEIAEDISG